jgi:hypothetical protein
VSEVVRESIQFITFHATDIISLLTLATGGVTGLFVLVAVSVDVSVQLLSNSKAARLAK